jgi:diamine N-acetyltransferase
MLDTGQTAWTASSPFWKKLRQHHKERSTNFSEEINQMSWEERKAHLQEKTQTGAILVQTAKDNGRMIGYCISSVTEKKTGELESIYVDKEYREHHIGDYFMKAAMAWMDTKGTKQRIIGVAVGNEEAFGFYEKYGFYPRTTILRRK